MRGGLDPAVFGSSATGGSFGIGAQQWCERRDWRSDKRQYPPAGKGSRRSRWSTFTFMPWPGGGWECRDPGGGITPKPEDQPHALAHAPGTTMRSPDKEREPVPVASDAERPLPDAWRTIVRRSEGQ
jgi:hypothetical protein